MPDTDGLRGPLESVDAAADGIEGVTVGVRVRGRGQVVAASVVGGLVFGALLAREDTITHHQRTKRRETGGGGLH